MIRAIRCDKKSFREVHFEPGFNVVLADITDKSKDKDSRNGVGKSTLIDIIHFCLGSTARKGSGPAILSLPDWTFTLDLDLGGTQLAVSRNTAKPATISVEGKIGSLRVSGGQELAGGNLQLRVQDWNSLLGQLMFGLSEADAGQKHYPTFRGLLSYFIRRGTDAFSTPFEHHRKMNETDRQVCNAFLLGLEWRYAIEWQHLKEKKKLHDNLRKAIDEGMMGETLGTVGELNARLRRLKTQADREKSGLDCSAFIASIGR